jgi:hypothetical protein
MWVLGYIPEEIGELECLKEIDFRLNKIKGTTLLSFLLRWHLILPIDPGKLPAAMVKLQHLEGLYLFDNYIEGECRRALFCVIPLTALQPERLCVLCAFSTSVVLSLCTSSCLRLLSVFSGAGKIPHALSKLPQLLGVYLYNNCFEGELLRFVCDVLLCMMCARKVATRRRLGCTVVQQRVVLSCKLVRLYLAL